MTWPSDLRKGDKGKRIQYVQEWLTLRGEGVVIDNTFGAATEYAVALHQRLNGLPITGVVDSVTWESLIAPYTRATTILPPEGRSLRELTLAHAERHLEASAREVQRATVKAGHRNNLGPWVRLYMQGKDGEKLAWCAGFAWYCLNQAASSLEYPAAPLRRNALVAGLVNEAKTAGRFVDGNAIKDHSSTVKPGWFFVIRGGSLGWKHVGIVREAHDAVFTTIEGNSNDDQQSSSFEVCSRIRSYRYPDKDFIRFEGL